MAQKMAAFGETSRGHDEPSKTILNPWESFESLPRAEKSCSYQSIATTEEVDVATLRKMRRRR